LPGDKQNLIKMESTTLVPTHIAIIMDGNRRWARKHNLPVLAGHQHVADKILEPLVEHAAELGIKYLTFWAWSTENWQRNSKEIEGVMRIFRHVIRKRWQRLHAKGVRIKVIGDLSKFSPDIQEALKKVVVQTKDNKKITAVFALNYGGRDELIRTFKQLTRKILDTVHSLDEARQQCNNITMKQLSERLDTAGVPDPDLIIRTGGERRLSGFLPWQSIYSELIFPSWYMPEFVPEKLDEVIGEYQKRSRRFGK